MEAQWDRSHVRKCRKARTGVGGTITWAMRGSRLLICSSKKARNWCSERDSDVREHSICPTRELNAKPDNTELEASLDAARFAMAGRASKRA